MKSFLVLCLLSMMTTIGFSQGDATVIYLVRHAEKADESRDPDLSEAGQRRAAHLADVLYDQPIHCLFATPYKRTHQTLQPLAQDIGLDIQTYDHRDHASMREALRACKEAVVVAGHSNSIPRLVNFLIGEEVYADLDERIFNKMWRLVMVDGRITLHELIEY
jgi:2,3-bisphosphoglycerate-dependent phosphoglycerate mutase